ncbi:MAG: ABC transporter substrate-binding protein [Candidatus Kariarchaeaceae archaeon]
MKNKLIIIYLSWILIGVTVNGFQANENLGNISINALPGTTTIGFLTPFTGGLSAYSLGFEHGAQLAIKHLNENSRYNYTNWQINFYDTQTSTTGAIDAMNQAITDGVVFVAGAAGASNTLAAASIGTSNKMPQISYASESKELTTYDDHAIAGDNGYLWRVAPSDAVQGKVMADVAKTGGYKTAVTILVNTSYGLNLAQSFKDSFEALPNEGTVLKEFAYKTTTLNVQSIVSQVKTEDPDVIIMIAYATDGAELFVELANQNLNKPIIGGDGVADPGIFGEFTGTKEAMQYVVTTKRTSPSGPSVTAFENAYAAEYPSDIGYIYTAEAYDAVMVGALAVMARNSTLGEDIIAELANVKYDGGSGHIEFDTNGDRKTNYFSISEVQNDQFVVVGSVIAGLLDLGSFIQKNVPLGTSNGITFTTISYIYSNITIIDTVTVSCIITAYCNETVTSITTSEVQTTTTETTEPTVKFPYLPFLGILILIPIIIKKSK